MKHIFLFTIVGLLTSCGNPHLGPQGGTDKLPYNPIQMECETVDTGTTHVQFFSGTHPYNTPAEFQNFSKCKNTITETFNSYMDGRTFMLTNESRENFYFELFHLGEKKVFGDKSYSLTDFFGSETFEMLVTPKISQNGISGQDKGVDSLKSDKAGAETLLWNYTTAISLWSAKVVDLEAGSILRVFDCDERLIKEIKVSYPANQSGVNELHFIGINSNKADICHVALTSVNSESLAVDEFSYGF